MPAHLIVPATVPPADRAAFEDWYQTEHLPDAKAAFRAAAAQRGWSQSDPALHIAIYTFPDIAHAEAIADSPEIHALIAEFDLVWQGRVTRMRDIVDIAQQI